MTEFVTAEQRDQMSRELRGRILNVLPSATYQLKMLSILDELTVYWALTDTPEIDKAALLREFMSNVSNHTRLSLYDNTYPFPFANLAHPEIG